MPNIREYTNPIDKLNPDEKGYQAFEMAGRRIGPLYNQSAADIEKGGKLTGQLNSQAMKAADEEIKALDEPTGKGGTGKGGAGGGGSGILNLRPAGGGGGRGYAPADASWAGTARDVTGAAAQAIKEPGGKVVDVSGIGNPLYTTGAPDSTPTASGSYSGQGGPKGTDVMGTDPGYTPADIARLVKQGDALYTQNWQGRGINGVDASGGIYGPIGSNTTVNGVVVNGPGSAATTASTWDQITGLAARGWNAITSAVNATAASSGDLGAFE